MIKYFLMVEILSADKRKSLKAQSFSLTCIVIVIMYNDIQMLLWKLNVFSTLQDIPKCFHPFT